ncbi:hypothetical protein EDD64_101109 [Effusibacillus lacus]|nr:hypothetical protein EDD64_101109 [Effusibacillus lacus]
MQTSTPHRMIQLLEKRLSMVREKLVIGHTKRAAPYYLSNQVSHPIPLIGTN